MISVTRLQKHHRQKQYRQQSKRFKQHVCFQHFIKVLIGEQQQSYPTKSNFRNIYANLALIIVPP